MSISYAQNVGLVKMPPRVEIGGITYRTVEINGLVWIAEDFKNPVGEYSVNDDHYFYYPGSNSIRAIESILPTGWRLSKQSDLDNLINYYSGHLEKLCSTHGWNGLGTNESGMNFEQLGYRYWAGDMRGDGESWHLRYYGVAGVNNSSYSLVLYVNNDNNSVEYTFKNGGDVTANRYYSRVPIRVCRDA